MFSDQSDYDIRCEWAAPGLTALAPNSEVVIIVDVLSFSTCVDIAVANGAIVYPYRWKDASAVEFAKQKGAELASFERRFAEGYSLSPASLVNIPADTRLVLPSPNGSALTLATGKKPTFTACLRNARAVAAAAARLGSTFAVIPAGERWPDDGGLRPALEDLLGAGAIISRLPGSPSPEARLAAAAFEHYKADLPAALGRCVSGRELIERGYADDVTLAAELDCSSAVPRSEAGAYINRAGT